MGLQVWANVSFPAADIREFALFYNYTDNLHHFGIDYIIWLGFFLFCMYLGTQYNQNLLMVCGYDRTCQWGCNLSAFIN